MALFEAHASIIQQCSWFRYQCVALSMGLSPGASVYMQLGSVSVMSAQSQTVVEMRMFSVQSEKRNNAIELHISQASCHRA